MHELTKGACPAKQKKPLLVTRGFFMPKKVIRVILKDMLRLSATLFKQPVVSLRTGGKIATAIEPVIDPRNLKVLGWWCDERGKDGPVILLTEDVRQMTPQGLAVDGEDELSEPKELVRHKEVLNIKFQLIGKTVKTKRRKLGKVNDFSYNDGMFVQKLYVSAPIVKLLSSTDTHLIDRTQIVEITDDYILVRDTEVTAGAEEMATAPAAGA